LLKKGHLLRFPHPSSLQRTGKYASLLRISGALHLALFEQPGKDDFFMLTVKFLQFKSESFLVGFLPPSPHLCLRTGKEDGDCAKNS
jgi:hypothetical protein